MNKKTINNALIPSTFLSNGEYALIQNLATLKGRIDGRNFNQSRKHKIVSFKSTNQNTSFIFCYGQTSVHCSGTPKLSFLNETYPDFFDIKITTCNASILTPVISSLTTASSKNNLEVFFKEILESSSYLKNYMTKEGGLAWKLSLNITLLTYEGNIVETIGCAVKELIKRINFPILKIKLNEKKGLKDYKVAYDEFETVTNVVLNQMKTPIVVKEINGEYVRDPNVEEEMIDGNLYIGLCDHDDNTIMKIFVLENGEIKECGDKAAINILKQFY